MGYLTESQIIALCENQIITIDREEYKIVPLVKGTNQKDRHSIRIKILNNNKSANSRDKGATSTIPIDLNTGRIREEDIEYGKDVKTPDRKMHRDIAAGLGVYTLNELNELDNGATTEKVTRFNKKAVEFSKLPKKERKMYTDMGNGVI